MHLRCATCLESWDSYHLYHDAIHETPAGQDWINYKLDYEDWQTTLGSFSHLSRRDVLKIIGEGPNPPPHEKWVRKLTPFWRAQLKLDGWEFGSCLVAVLRCPCCPKDREDEDSGAADRRAETRMVANLLEGDDDGIAATLEHR